MILAVAPSPSGICCPRLRITNEKATGLLKAKAAEAPASKSFLAQYLHEVSGPVIVLMGNLHSSHISGHGLICFKYII